jgi:hypothetical protein
MKGYAEEDRLKVKGKNLQHLLRFT